MNISKGLTYIQLQIVIMEYMLKIIYLKKIKISHNINI